MKNKLKFDLELNNRIYTFRCESKNKNDIEYYYIDKFKHYIIKLDYNKLKDTLSKLLVFDNQENQENPENIKNKQLISTQIADYMEFINIINYNNQIEEAFNQMIIIIFNNKWILNMEFIKLKIKNCLIKYFNKVEISEYYYMVLFLIDSIKDKDYTKELEYDFDNNYDDIDYELYNCNYLNFSYSDNLLDFIFF